MGEGESERERKREREREREQERERMASAAAQFVGSMGGGISASGVASALSFYKNLHTVYGGDEEERKDNYQTMSNIYYNIAIAFQEFGWGQSFHFGSRSYGESLRESIKRQEHYLALRLGLKPGMKVLDVGCGVGGPLREIAAFSGASITGLNINEYQIKRGIKLNEEFGLAKNCDFLKGDFMNIPVLDGTYDAIYNMNACCHSPDLVALFKELKRVLKPGQLFAGSDWCMTETYDSQSSHHQAIKAEIEFGNGLPSIRTTTQYIEALKEAGFEVLMNEDLAEKSYIPWYEPLRTKRLSLVEFKTIGVGRFFGRPLVWMLELFKIVPKGTLEVYNLLDRSRKGLVAGGELNIFTPMFFYLARKPLK